MKAKQPVSVGGIEFDALISEERTFEATVPEYPVEEGFSVSDAIILSPEKLSMVLYVTDTPVTWYKRHGSSMDRSESVCKKLEELYYTGKPVTISTSSRAYTDMAIESMTISKSTETGYSREIPISFKKIRVSTAKTTTIPESYGKSGTTAAAAGAANTSSGTSSTSKSNSGSSSSESGGTKDGSIAYHIYESGVAMFSGG